MSVFFQYFLPGRTKVTRDELLALGLAYAFEPETAAAPQANLAPREVTNGPGGQHGLVVSLSTEFCGYYQDQQIWKQEVDTDYWVGMWTAPDKRPTPETLARANQIMGQWLRLADGRNWLLPMARHWEDFEGQIKFVRTIPSRLTRDAAGNWFSGEVKERFRELWRLAAEYMQAYLDGTAASFREIDNLVIECFKCNYRLSAIELDLLGLHEDHLRVRVPEILLDTDSFDALLKKKLTTLDTGSSTPGLAESPPDAATATTDPPGAT